MVGPGIVDYGWLAIMPVSVGPSHDLAKKLWSWVSTKYGYRSFYSHLREQHEPGYYKVHLSSYNVLAEMTATDHVGVHRYTWKGKRDQNVILFDSSYTVQPKACADSYVYIDLDNNAVYGWVLVKGTFSGRFGGAKAYFYAQIGSPIKEYGVWDQAGIHPHSVKAQQCSSGAYIKVADSQTSVHYGISFVNQFQAKENIIGETGMASFDAIRAYTQKVWKTEFDRFTVTTQKSAKSETDLTIFYSSLYHSMLSPTKWSEVTGIYMGFDMQAHIKPLDMEFVYTVSHICARAC